MGRRRGKTWAPRELRTFVYDFFSTVAHFTPSPPLRTLAMQAHFTWKLFYRLKLEAEVFLQVGFIPIKFCQYTYMAIFSSSAPRPNHLLHFPWCIAISTQLSVSNAKATAKIYKCYFILHLHTSRLLSGYILFKILDRTNNTDFFSCSSRLSCIKVLFHIYAKNA